MNDDPRDGNPRAGDHRRPRRRRGATFPVQTADNHRSGTAGKNGAGDGEEQKDVFALLEDQAEEESEHADEE